MSGEGGGRTRRGRLLVVDDEANARTALAEILREEGFDVEIAADGFKALGKMAELAPELVLTDLKMPGMDGIELMRKARTLDPEVGVVIMTAFATVDSAVAAMREGAADYLTKPLRVDKLALVLDRVIERRRLRAETRLLRERLRERRFERIVGQSPSMLAIYRTVAQVAPSRASVLIAGEAGTGKELVAQAIHERSPRAGGPFVKLHCAVLTEALLECELFGHEAGALPGAPARREGRLPLAEGGTLFLDEIGDVSPATQVKLLRLLTERTYERVGGTEPLQSDARVIAATTRDLEQLVKQGRFRKDLYYRLNVVNVEVPPLRARPSDIPLLAMHFLEQFARENGKAVSRIADDALSRLVAYAWPGNVRELENAIERGVVMGDGAALEVRHLPPQVAATEPESPLRIPGSTLAEIERTAILATLEATAGSTSRAAEILGISVRKVQYKLHEYRGAPKKGAPVVEEAVEAPEDD